MTADGTDKGFAIFDQDGNEIGRSVPGASLIRVNLHPGVRGVTTGSPDEDFYEDDEPTEKIRAAFERGPKGVTGRP